MKRSIFYFTGLLFLLIINSCKEDKIPNPINVFTSTFEAKIDGEDFAATTKFYNDDTGYVIITGQRIEGGAIKDQIVLTIPTLETGSYTFGLDNIILMTYHNSDSSSVYTSISGTVTITEIDDDKLSGVFDFQATSVSLNTIHISDGVFEGISKIVNK